MKEKKITRILRIFMMLLTCILIALFFGIMILVSDMQGTARVVNYAGLVRGKTQQIIKLENAQRRVLFRSGKWMRILMGYVMAAIN